ncbi:MAG: hypothetical protein ACRDGV_02415 [Candidatus Limnocylindria bacterium]
MAAFGVDDLAAAKSVAVDVYTSAYRVSGQVRTRFARVAEILNQLTSTHLPIENATISEYGHAAAAAAAPQSLVALNEILLMVATGIQGDPRPDMKVPKRGVRAQLALPPFMLSGTVHVPQGSRPADGLLNLVDQFVAMTDVTIASGAYPELERAVAAVALRRDRVHVLMVSDDERPDELLADVLDERTAEGWLRAAGEESGR